MDMMLPIDDGAKTMHTAHTAQWADLLRLVMGRGAAAEPSPGTLAQGALPAHSPLPVWRIRRDAVLLQEGAPAQSVFVVRSGSFKCVKTGEDGYEQVLFFAQAGDVLGFEALHAGHQPVSVVALEVATAYALPAQTLTDLRQRAAVLDLALQWALSRQMGRVAQVTEMMAAVSADTRLARFLTWMSQRMQDIGQSPHSLLLRMGRRDIASLLAVAHETVSRSFTTLADAGYIEVHNRDVEIRDLEGLRQRARCTRGLTPPHPAQRKPAPAASAAGPAAVAAACPACQARRYAQISARKALHAALGWTAWPHGPPWWGDAAMHAWH